MDMIFLASGIMDVAKGYLPLITVCVALVLILLVFKLVGVSFKLLWKILVNSLLGAGLLIVFDLLFAGVLHMSFFYIDLTWINAIIAGVLGVPGIIILLVLKYVLK